MMLEKKIPLGIYSANIMLYVYDDAAAFQKYFNKKYDATEDISEWNCGAFIQDKGRFFLLLRQRSLSYNTICHELFHAAHRIGNSRNVEDHEAQAWLCGYLSQMTFKILADNNIQITHGG